MHHLLRKQIKLVALVAGFIAYTSAMAQDKEIYRPEHDDLRYYFGITLGYNSSYLHTTLSNRFLKDDSILVARPKGTGGIALGFLGTLRLDNHFQLRINPQLILGGAKPLDFTVLNGTTPSGIITKDTIETLNSTIISLPIQIKFNSDRIDNFRFYALGGIKIDRDISSNSSERNLEGLLKLKANDFGLETGVGLNFYLPYVTISPEIKFSYGLTNLNQVEPTLKYSAVFDKIQSRMISFSLHFED
jgi:hypothetical protein